MIGIHPRSEMQCLKITESRCVPFRRLALLTSFNNNAPRGPGIFTSAVTWLTFSAAWIVWLTSGSPVLHGAAYSIRPLPVILLVVRGALSSPDTVVMLCI